MTQVGIVIISCLLMIVLLCGAVTVIARSAPSFAASLGGMEGKIENLVQSAGTSVGLQFDTASFFSTLDIKPYVAAGLSATSARSNLVHGAVTP